MSWFALNLVIHILAACIWIGGQATVAYLMPALHDMPERAYALGLRFQKLAWSAFAILVLTGLGNMLFLHLGVSDLLHSRIGHLLDVKLILVLLSGGTALAHALLQSSDKRSGVVLNWFKALNGFTERMVTSTGGSVQDDVQLAGSTPGFHRYTRSDSVKRLKKLVFDELMKYPLAKLRHVVDGEISEVGQ